MRMNDSSPKEIRSADDGGGVLKAIGWLGVVFLGIWTLWCAAYHACSIVTPGEVVAVRQVVERGHRGRPYTATYIKVSYRDHAGGRHEIEETAWHAQPGDARMIRYPSFQPSNGRIDEGVWLIWKPCLFAWMIFGGILGAAAYVRFSIQELKGEPEGGSGQTGR